MQAQPNQTIVFETLIDGQPVRHEARVTSTDLPRSRVAKGQLVVEHISGDYAISIDIRDGEYVANRINEAIIEELENHPSPDCPCDMCSLVRRTLATFQ